MPTSNHMPSCESGPLGGGAESGAGRGAGPAPSGSVEFFRVRVGWTLSEDLGQVDAFTIKDAFCFLSF